MALGRTVFSELNHLPCDLLEALPEAFELWTRHDRLGIPVLLRSTRSGPVVDGPPNAIVFRGGELAALAIGVATERFQQADFERVCVEKRDNPGLHLSIEAALAGAYVTLPVPSLSLGAVLSELGLEPLSVRLVSEYEPGELAQAA